jgi:hypothetical protein
MSVMRLPVGSLLLRRTMLHIALMSSENRAAFALSRDYPGGRAAPYREDTHERLASGHCDGALNRQRNSRGIRQSEVLDNRRCRSRICHGHFRHGYKTRTGAMQAGEIDKLMYLLPARHSTDCWR